MLSGARAIVIGGSAGAVEALGRILPQLPASTRLPIVVCVHVPPSKPSLLPELFAGRCAIPVREPWDKEPIAAGIWFAPSDYHLLIGDEVFELSADDPVNFSRPSIDVLFESAATAWGRSAVAVVLTGANDDGAEGARAIREAGGVVVVQDPTAAVSPSMPEAAIARASPQIVTGVDAIGQMLSDAVTRGRR